MKKKMLVAILLMILCLSFSISAFALTEGDWEFQLLDDEVTITDYLGEGGDVVIPSEIYGRPVTKVEISGWSRGFYDAESVEYPGTVKRIENNKVSINLKCVVLNEGTEEIASSAFKGCENLKDINIPTTIARMEHSAFSECTSLDKINLHKGIKEIGSQVFEGTAIQSINMNDLPDDCIIWNTSFRNCKELKTVVWNSNFKVIPHYVFNGCTSLENVEIPNGVEVIDHYAFAGCTSLEEIVFPTTLKTISRHAFAACEKLKEVIIPYGTEHIEYDVFNNCKSLEAIYLPDTIKHLSEEFIDGSDNCIVYCSADSYVAQVCKKHEISYLTDNSVNSLITVYYNGRRVSFHEQGQNPELINDRTLVPLRAIFEAMDADVEWNQETKTVTATRDNVEISISIGANVMYKDGEEIAVDVPAQLINDRTMVPVRVIAEAFGADVKWNNNGKAVLIEE